MDIRVFDSDCEIGKAAAQIIIDCIKTKEKPVLGLATGASPVPTYKCLIDAYNKGEISFKNVTTFNLDEYCGIPASDKNSYYTFMHEKSRNLQNFAKGAFRLTKFIRFANIIRNDTLSGGEIA